MTHEERARRYLKAARRVEAEGDPRVAALLRRMAVDARPARPLSAGTPETSAPTPP